MLDPLLQDFAADQAFLRRLARRLVRDEHAADDLVQGAWLAALERPPARGRLRAWLARVVRNQALNDARDDDRRRAREQAVARESDSGDEMESRLALQEEVLRAVRALREPFRGAIVLRYADGIAPSEIARQLNVPVATVKARLSHGLKLLREDLDRRSTGNRAVWLGPLAAWSDPHVVGRAALSLRTILGSWIMKKSIAIAAVLAGVLLLRATLSEPPSPQQEVLVSERPAVLEAEDDEAIRLDAPAIVHPEERTRAAVPIPASASLRGRVVDGRTSEPLAGVEIEFHARRELTLRQLKREHHGFLRQGWDGTVSTHAEWIDLPEEVGFSAIARDELISVGTPPRASEGPLAATRSDAAGDFALEVGADGGMLRFAQEGYGGRVLPARTGEEELVVELWPGGQLVGQVINAQGEALEQVFELRFVDSHDGKLVGYQDVTTDEHGVFDVLLAGENVSPRSRTPGWKVTNVAMHPVRKQRWAFRSSFEPGNEPEPVFIAVGDAREGTILRIVDDETDAPVEDFWLLVRDEHRAAVRECGFLHAPRGEWPLARDVQHAGAWALDYMTQTYGTATAWTAEHAPETVTFENLLAGEVLEVRLKKGAGTSAVAGRVVDAGHPIADVEVILRPFLRDLHRSLDDPRRLDVARTDQAGFFVLHGPPGAFAIQANHAGEYRKLDVELPIAGTVVIDFAEACAFELTLRDRNGAPCADFPLSVNGDGLQISGRTDETGFARFVPLDAGKKEIYLAYESHVGSFTADEVREITLLPHQTLREVWFLPIPAEPVHPRLVVDGWEGPFTGWRARSGSHGSAEWREVAADGTIPIDVQHGNLWLYIEGAGRAWKRGIWNPPGPDPTVHLALGGPGYAGVVRRTSGEPYRRLRVFATPRDGPSDFHLTSSAVTDDEGRFHLVGLEPVPHLLEFHPVASAHTRERDPNPLSAVLFEATAPAGDPPVQLELTLPEKRGAEYPDYDTVHFSGHVSNAATGIAEPGARVDVVSVYPQREGALLVHAYTWKTADESAAYTEGVPRAPHYRATVHLANYALGVTSIEWEDGGAGSEVTRDLVFDPE